MTDATNEAITVLEKLVAFDTTSRNSNLALVDYVEGYLKERGVTSERVINESGDKASLFATIGPVGIPGVALSAHTDVVPVDGQDWATDPFKLTRKDGKLYGRGACDMKGFLACCLANVSAFTATDLKTPIHLAFSYDEEVGCTGVRPMIAQLGSRFVKPRLVIVGEPTSMMVVDAHKGPVRWQVTIRGRAAHSSMAPLGVNTITAAGHLLVELAAIENDLKVNDRNDRFDPPYTTLQVTEIEGGTASNIVPEETWFGWEIRALPGTDPDAIENRLRAKAATLLPAMRDVAPEADIEILRTNDVPPFGAAKESPAVTLALKLAEQNETHCVAYATEASLFDRAGSPSVVCGPGDIAQAHTPNEWIEIAELEKCNAFMSRLTAWASTDAPA
ncbi:MAG: acetylornithine deacetylase [Hyphomicrobiaceae bacterium]|nr:acetylornithine deacetylase [Hyphomicrobiaceae bacterium]